MPLTARLVSSVVVPDATVPCTIPTLSVIAVTAAVVVGAAVLREGAEVVLFLYGVALGGSSAVNLLIGGLLGLLLGGAVTGLTYLGLLRIPTRYLFTVTSWLITLLAAGLAAQSVGYLAKAGVIFMPISEALREHPDLVQKYLGTVVPTTDNFFATLNSAVFSDGSFVYVPPGVRCPMELSTYFRINEKNTGQFERTLIIADKGSYVSYLEGCTAPMRDENQLHAAVVELVALDDAEIKYSTVQNWYPGDAEGKGGIYNFVTKRGDCRGANSKISWTQVETGSAITWKYPSCILRGDNSRGEFYSIAISNGKQQVDSGTKMIHLGKNTSSRIISKGISAGRSNNTYRGLVSAHRKATNARNFTNCDSLLIGHDCGAHTVPYIEAKNSSAVFEHEATTSKISEEMLFYCRQRGLSAEEAVALVVNGFVKDVLQQLPMEFAVEAQKLISISLEGSVG